MPGMVALGLPGDCPAQLGQYPRAPRTGTRTFQEQAFDEHPYVGLSLRAAPVHHVEVVVHCVDGIGVGPVNGARRAGLMGGARRVGLMGGARRAAHRGANPGGLPQTACG